MSINQLQEIPRYPGWRDWLNSRVDDLKIYSQLNWEMDLAVPGDVLELNSSLEPVWVPSSAIATNILDHMMVKSITYNFIPGTDLPILFNSIPLIPSANITIVANELVITHPGIYMFFLNYNVNIANTTENPSLTLQRWDSATGAFINDGDGLGISAIIPQSGATLGEQSLCSAWPVIVAEAHPSDNRFRMVGSNPGTSTVALDAAKSVFTVVRIS